MTLALAVLLSPLLLGIVNRTKAYFAGRKGPPVLQPYFDLIKLLRKGAVYSRTTTWIFRAGPMVALAAFLAAAALAPLGGLPAAISFPGDLVLFAYLLGIARFFTVLAALDTGSSFEGMGAGREVQFSALAEPTLLLGLAAMARETGRLSLSEIYAALSWSHAGPAPALLGAAFFVIFLAENARIPVDDPNTHLELTMIHEAMVLDHCGPDLGFILYGTALKMWVLGALIVGIAVRHPAGAVGGMFLLAIVVGVVESVMARLRLVRVPQLLVGAGALSVLALVLVLR